MTPQDDRDLWPRDPEAAAAFLAGEPLPCDRSADALPCAITTGAHDEWCAVFAARRRWYEARRDYGAGHPLPHSRPTCSP